jgi:hypothetical protein
MSDANNHNLSVLMDAALDEETINQATGLRNVNCMVLYHLSSFLDTPARFQTWCCEIFSTLRLWGLERLIDRSIPRPARGHPNSRIWRKVSKQVSKWLAWNMHPTLVGMIRAIHGQSTYSDDFMEGVKVVFRAGELVVRPQHDVRDMMNAVICVTHCKRAGWPNAKSFVYRLMEYYYQTKGMQMKIPAFVPLSVLLGELQFEFTDLIEAKLDEVQQLPNAAQDITNADFLGHCHDLLEYIELHQGNEDSGMGEPDESMDSDEL